MLHLRGTPAEMGRQHGLLLRRQLEALRTGYLDRFVGTGARRSAFLAGAVGLAAHMPKPYVSELQALAKATAEPYADALLANTFLDLSRSVRCSVAIATGKATADGRTLFARNNDFPTLGIAHKASVLVVYHHDDPATHSFVSVTWPGMIGVASGMNDAGLCVATLESLSEHGCEPGVPFCLMYRQVLERCRTPREALALIRATRRTSPNNLAVAGPAGEPLIIEFSPTKVAARAPTDGILLCTNHFRAPELVAGSESACARYATLARLARRRDGRLDVGALKAMLRAVGNRITLQSMIFEPHTRTLHLAVGRVPAAEGPYVTIDCTRLFDTK